MPSLNHNPMQEAHEAPRCQHIRMNGRRCGSPALRGENYCYFHDSVENPSGSYSLPFPEDATSLQYGVMMVIRMLISGHVEIKRCWALLYSLQIASANLRTFAAERPSAKSFLRERQPASFRPPAVRRAAAILTLRVWPAFSRVC